MKRWGWVFFGCALFVAVCAVMVWKGDSGRNLTENEVVEAFARRIVAVELKHKALAKDIDELQLLVLRESAVIARRLQNIEMDRRPEIHVGKATIYNTDGEIVIATLPGAEDAKAQK